MIYFICSDNCYFHTYESPPPQINPPQYIPLVEVIPASWTDPAIVTTTVEILKGIGQAPVVAKKEINGFIVNRLQYALIMEAWRLVEVGTLTSDAFAVKSTLFCTTKCFVRVPVMSPEVVAISIPLNSIQHNYNKIGLGGGLVPTTTNQCGHIPDVAYLFQHICIASVSVNLLSHAHTGWCGVP